MHDGMLFAYGFGDELQALDARIGRLALAATRIRSQQGAAPNHKRGIALYGDNVYMGTSDAHVIAVDAQHRQARLGHRDRGLHRRESMSAGPLIAHGVLMIGTTGTGVGAALGGPQIVGLDADTGAVEWRVHTIAQPGSPAATAGTACRSSSAAARRSGTPAATIPSLGLAYFGTGNTYDTGPLLRATPQPGVTNAALYTDSTLAIDPDTGELKWAFQHLPNDQWDLDYAFERQLCGCRCSARRERSRSRPGKLGIYEGIDAETGEFVFAFDVGLQNIVTAIDPETGAHHDQSESSSRATARSRSSARTAPA